MTGDDAGSSPMPMSAHLAAGRAGSAIGHRRAGIVTARCDGCAKEYLEYRRRYEKSRHHYCTRACMLKHRVGPAHTQWSGGRFSSCTCPSCGKVFSVERRRGRKKYCSKPCAGLAIRKFPDHKSMLREMHRRREARLRAGRQNISAHTYEQWEDLKRRAKNRCVKCHKKVLLTRDHIIPLSKGGNDAITNIQPLCWPCNSRKHANIETLL